MSSNRCDVANHDNGAEMQPIPTKRDDSNCNDGPPATGHRKRKAVKVTLAIFALEATCWIFGGEKLYAQLQSSLDMHPRTPPTRRSKLFTKQRTSKRRESKHREQGDTDTATYIKREYRKWHAIARNLSQMELQPPDWTPNVNWANHPRHRSDRFPSVEERVEYYMGRWHNASIPMYGSDFTRATYIQRKTTRQYGPFSDILVDLYGLDRDRLWKCYQNKKELNVFSPYCRDYIDVAILHSEGTAGVLHYIGDGLPYMPDEMVGYPLLAKVRPLCNSKEVGDDDGGLENRLCGSEKRVEPIILPLNRKRHYSAASTVPQNDIPWKKKIGKAVWRGQYGKTHDTITDTNDVKYALVSKHLNSTLVDAKFSKHTKDAPPQTIGSYLDVKAQLRYKYIISIEGNDVSSGLKWMLLSNSVVMVPPITWESWAMEGKLEPFVHYIPLKADMSNVEEMVAWAESNPEETRMIAERSTLFVYDLLFHPNAIEDERKIMIAIMERFERNFGSKERRVPVEVPEDVLKDRALRFPSVEDRVKHVMGKWYHNRDDLSMKRPDSNRVLRSLGSKISADGLFLASGSQLASCATPNGAYSSEISALCRSSLPEFDERNTADLKSNSFNRLLKTKKGEKMRLAPMSSWRHDVKGTKESKRVLLDDSVKVLCYRDCSGEEANVPHFARSRRISDNTEGDAIIWPFNLDEAVRRVKSSWLEAEDSNFESKLPKAFRRDGLRGQHVSLSLAPTNDESERKGRNSGILSHRYLVATESEDDDVEDLLWMLLSQSVVLMPRERQTTSWFLESFLQPYEHFVPIASDYSDVDAMVRWCESNIEEARLISQRATLFVYDMLLDRNADKDNEEVKLRVMERYAKLYG